MKLIRLNLKGIWLLVLFIVMTSQIYGIDRQYPDCDPCRLEVALNSLSEHYSVLFSYKTNLVKDVEVSFQIREEENFDRALNRLIMGLDLSYKSIDSKYYLLYSEGSDNLRGIRKMERKIKSLRNLEEETGIRLFKRPDNDQLALQRIYESVQTQFEGIVVEGMVVNEEKEPLIGVNILVKGTNQGTSTDFDGKFTLEDIDENSVLLVSYIGYRMQELPVAGKSNLYITLVSDSQLLDEVVVTAFGIEREKKALTYSSQEVDGKALSRVGNADVIKSIQGKVAGVTVRQQSGAPGSETYITIRGSRSFLNNNQPLYIVDGLPVDGNSRAVDINPSDIESLSVLKGASAAALYGLRAANGVVLITTKRGKGATIGRPVVSFETSYTADRPTRLPELQMKYGQGTNFNFSPTANFSYGPEIATMGKYINQLGEEEEARAYNNTEEFFKTGGRYTYNANVNVSNNFDRGNYSFGMGYTDQAGLVKSTDFQRINFKVASDYQLADNLTAGISLNVSDVILDRTNGGQGGSSLFYAAFASPPSYNLAGKQTHYPGEPYRQINFRNNHDNIYWALENNSIREKTARTFGNINLKYQPLEWLSVNYRVGMDTYTSSNKTVYSLGAGDTGGRTDPPSGGLIRDQMVYNKQINSNFNLSIEKDFGNDFSMDFLLGNEFYDRNRRTLTSEGRDIIIGGFNHISNTGVVTSDEYIARSRVIGVYGNLGLTWRNAVFLTATGRQDRVSNMPPGSRTFFYPSVGLGVAFTEFLSIPENILTFGKVRASVAAVGQAGDLYATNTVFVQPGNSGTGSFTFPYNGINAFTRSNVQGSSDLVPENTETFEIGFDLRFIDNRIGIDYTYYSSSSKNQIFDVPVAASTGFTREIRNSGEMSAKGHEVMLNVVPFKKKNFRWDLTTNFTSYDNKVVSLGEGIESLSLGGFLVNIVAREGQPYPAIEGRGYVRDANGSIVVDNRPSSDGYGMPLTTTSNIPLGSVQPDFEIGLINSFSFYGINITTQFDFRKGGNIVSGGHRLGRLYGTLKETEDRESDYVFPGVKGFFDSDGETPIIEGANDIIIQRGFSYFRQVTNGIDEFHMFDADFVRLRELKVSYDLPYSLTKKIGTDGASIYLIGRNLWLNSALPNFDPELSRASGHVNATGGEEYVSYPQIKSFGGGLKLTF